MSAENQLIRIQEILARREELVPILDPAQSVTPEQVNGFLDLEKQAMTDTLEQLKGILTPYATIIHATLTDKLNHPEELLLRDKNKRIQFAMHSSHPEFVTLITMKSQKGFINSKNELICESAIFCETPTHPLKTFANQFMEVGFDPNPNLDGAWHKKIPAYYNYIVGFRFDFRGIPDLILSHDGRSRVASYNYADFYWFEFNPPENTTYRKPAAWGVNSGTYHKWKYTYRYCEDGMFRREPVSENTQTIEEEIGDILSKLPFTDFDTSPFKQFNQ